MKLVNSFNCYLISLLTAQSAMAVNPLLIAAGQNLSGAQPPMLAVSNSGISTWSLVTSGLPQNGFFVGAGCTGDTSTGVCAAVGSNASSSGTPLLYVSTNGGLTWSVKTPSVSPGIFNAVSCTGGGGAPTVCAAAGQSDNSSASALLAASSNGGSSWSSKSVTHLPSTSFFNGVSCTGSSTTAICVAVGQNSSNNGPALAVSTNGGQNWTAQTFNNSNGVIFNAVSCTGSGTSVVCAAVGEGPNTNNTSSPRIAISTDGAINWRLVPLSGGVTNGTLTSVSCRKSGVHSFCVAGGSDGQAPLLAVSGAGGSGWQTKSFTGMPTLGVFNGVSCAGNSSGSSGNCYAVGINDDSGTTTALAARSGNNGATWSLMSIAGGVPRGEFNTVSCTPSHGCVIAGKNEQDGSPLLAVGGTGGLFTLVSVASSGIFNGSGAGK